MNENNTGAGNLSRVELIREVFRYNRRFTGARFVFQLSSQIIAGESFPSLVKDLATLHHSGISIILVPGAGRQIDDLLIQFGRENPMAGGIRISSEENLPIIKMAAFDVANQLMTELSSHRISSVIGNWVRARTRGVIKGNDYQRTGEVDKISIGQIEKVLADNLVPILPCIGWNAGGKAYNIPSIELAARLATGIAAEKLFYISGDLTINSEHFLLDLENPVIDSGRLTRMSAADAARFISINSDRLTSLWAEILSAGAEAASHGVNRVHILDGREDGTVLNEIFSTRGSGTLIHEDPFEQIRAMNPGDVGDVLRLLGPGIASGNLINRSREDLSNQYNSFAVFETDGSLRGCGALIEHDQGTGEIAAMAVDPQFSHLGIGNKLLRYFMGQARERNFTRLFALTTQAADWFENMGFKQGSTSDLPGVVRQNYNQLRLSRIYLLDLS